MKPILVTCYVNPDLDGYAGVFAYAEFLEKKGIDVIAGIIGNPHDEAKYVLKKFDLEAIKIIPNDELFDEVILIDASDINGLEGKVRAEKVIEIIDHRKVNEADKFPKAKAQIELVGAAATLVAEKFKQENISISQGSAILIYSAIISNTLNFQSGTTTERDQEMAQWLKQFIHVSEDYWKELFMAKSDFTGEELTERIKGDFAWFILGDKKLGIAQLEIMEAEKLVNQRRDDIISILEEIKKELGLDFIFLNIIDLEKQKNLIVTNDHPTKDLLERTMNIKFKDTIAVKEQLLMRKQIVPLIKDELEK